MWVTDSQIGKGRFFSAECDVYAALHIGKRVRVHSGTVIGSDGFGYVFDRGCTEKCRRSGT